MTKKLTALLMLAFIVAVLAVGCAKKDEAKTESSSTTTTETSTSSSTTDTAASMAAPADTTKH